MELIPKDVFNTIILKAIDGYIKVALYDVGAHQTENASKIKLLLRMRLVNKLLLNRVAHFVIQNTPHKIVHRNLCFLISGATPSYKYEYEDDARYMCFQKVDLIKLCEQEAGQNVKKRSLLTALIIYLQVSSSDLCQWSGGRGAGKSLRDMRLKRFRELCVHKRGEFCVAFKALGDAMQWTQILDKMHTMQRQLRFYDDKFQEHSSKAEDAREKRDVYSAKTEEAEKKEQESLSRLKKRIKVDQ